MIFSTLFKFNKNRSCIEIIYGRSLGLPLPWFNKNRSCIEISVMIDNEFPIGV